MKEVAAMGEYVIECSECAAGDPAHLDECLVALLDGLEPGAPAVFDDAEMRALRALRDGGLLPAATELPRPRLPQTGS